MSELGKPFAKNQAKKIFKKTENQGQNTACKKKPLARNGNLVQTKTMNGLGKPFGKKSDPKNRKNRKSKIAACEQKNH